MRRYAEMLVELQPESPIATEALATLAFADGDYLTAARYCRNLSEAAPDHASAVPKRVCELGPATFPSCNNFAQISSIVEFFTTLATIKAFAIPL